MESLRKEPPLNRRLFSQGLRALLDHPVDVVVHVHRRIHKHGPSISGFSGLDGFVLELERAHDLSQVRGCALDVNLVPDLERLFERQDRDLRRSKYAGSSRPLSPP